MQIIKSFRFLDLCDHSDFRIHAKIVIIYIWSINQSDSSQLVTNQVQNLKTVCNLPNTGSPLLQSYPQTEMSTHEIEISLCTQITSSI